MMGSAADIVQQIANGSRSAAAVLAQCQELIAAKDPALNCFTAKTLQRAEREAAAIDGLCAAGKRLPPLAGVPYAVKNLFDIGGTVTLAGAKINAANAPAAADATIVARMSRAGAVLVGALNMEELAYGFLTENHSLRHHAQPPRPHPRRRRLFRRLGCGGRRRNAADHARVRHQRLDSRARVALRCVWPEANLWTIAAQRHVSLREQPGSCGSFCKQRPRIGACVRRDAGTGSHRSCLRPARN